MQITVKDENKQPKTYETGSYELTWGVMEDVAKEIDLDSLKTGTQAEIMSKAWNMLKGGGTAIKGLFFDIFPQMTEAEFRTVPIKQLVQVIAEVVAYTMEELAAGDEKNAPGLR